MTTTAVSKSFLVPAALFGCLLMVSATRASMITFILTGKVNAVVSPIDQVSPIPAPFDGAFVGAPFTVKYTLDTGTADRTPTEPNIGTYAGVFANFAVTIGTASASTTFGGVNTINGDSLPNQGDTYSAVGLYGNFLTSITLTDSTDSAMTSDANLDTLDVADFDATEFHLIAGSFPVVSGTVDAITVIPEPSTAGFIAMGVLAAVLGTRQRLLLRHPLRQQGIPTPLTRR